MTILFVVYDIFRFGFFIVFTALHFFLMLGLLAEWQRDRRCQKNKISGSWVSVIIPIHNESLRMEGLLSSLKIQKYPNAEFIFVDDRSSDNSAEIIQEFISDKPNMRLLSILENPLQNRKQYALGKGIELAKGEFILFTDADCEIPPEWILSMVKRMANPQTGAVLGPVFKKQNGSGFFQLYQCFEHAVRYMYLAASTGIGAAGGGFGNNLIIRKASLDEIGGYANVPGSPTEDAALVSKIRSSTKYRVRAATGKDVHVITSGEKNWSDFITQTLRWNNGGLFSPDIATRFNFGFLMITISMGILAMPLLFFIPSLWPLSAAVIISMSGNTIATLSLFGVSLPKKKAEYIIQMIFTPVYFTFLTILGLCGVKPEWRGKKI